MIYLDYSATTKPDNRVVKYFVKCCDKYFGNANSLYKIGRQSKSAIDRASRNICKILNLDNHDLIFTSGATEANNLAIKGVVESLPSNRKRIITSVFEHSSIVAPINFLQKKGYVIDLVHINKDGEIDLQHLRSLMSDDVALVSIGSVNSELGIRQPIGKIAAIAHQNNVLFHCDVTQSVGKEIIDFASPDLISFSAHKFYGIKGIGVLAKRKDVKLTSQIHGGHSTTIYRSGTPNTALILSLDRALRIIYRNHEKKYAKVQALNLLLQDRLAVLPNVLINSPKDALPHILNFSVLGHSSRQMVAELSRKEIYISNHSACASNTDKSLAVLVLTDDLKRAKSSLRISLSHQSKKSEIKHLIFEIKRITETR